MNVDLLIADMFARVVEEECSSSHVRDIEKGASSAGLWACLSKLGFPDLMMDEDEGGAAAGHETLGALFQTCGRQALPVPLAFTIWIRGILARHGITPPDGPITLARISAQGAFVRCAAVPFAVTAQWVLAYDSQGGMLLPVGAAHVPGCPEGNRNTLRRDLEWEDLSQAVKLDFKHDWHTDGALIVTALMAGAAGRCLELAVDYANTRRQFGRPIGRFQAVQQQLSILAEEVFSVRMAAGQACAGYGGGPLSCSRVAMAKGRASEAAVKIAAISHGVIGAIGITDEFDLHLYTRRLHEWRQDFGGEAAWYGRVGHHFLTGSASGQWSSALDFLIAHAPAG